MTTSTIKSSGGTYTTLAAWEADISSSPTEEQIASIEEAFDVGPVKINVSNANLVLLQVTVAVGFRFTDYVSWPDMQASENQGAHIASNVTKVIDIITKNVDIEWLSITNLTGFKQNWAFSVTGNSDARIGNCIAHNFNQIVHNAGTLTVVCEYVVGYSKGTNGLINTGPGTINAYHCSMLEMSTGGFIQSAGTMTTDNCVALGLGASWSGTITGDWNLDDDSTAPGVNSDQTTAAAYFEGPTEGSEDLHRKSTLTSGQFVGADQTANTGGIDIDEEAVTQHHIGADEVPGQIFSITVVMAIDLGVTQVKTYPHTVVTEILIADALADVECKELDVFDCIASDLDLVDGRVLVSIERKGSQTLNALVGRIEFSDVLVLEAYAFKSMVTERDLMQANAAWRAADTRFRMAAEDVTFTPEPGDKLTLGTEVWDVLGTNIQVGETQVMIWCRRV